MKTKLDKVQEKIKEIHVLLKDAPKNGCDTDNLGSQLQKYLKEENTLTNKKNYNKKNGAKFYKKRKIKKFINKQFTETFNEFGKKSKKIICDIYIDIARQQKENNDKQIQTSNQQIH